MWLFVVSPFHKWMTRGIILVYISMYFTLGDGFLETIDIVLFTSLLQSCPSHKPCHRTAALSSIMAYKQATLKSSPKASLYRLLYITISWDTGLTGERWTGDIAGPVKLFDTNRHLLALKNIFACMVLNCDKLDQTFYSPPPPPPHLLLKMSSQ